MSNLKLELVLTKGQDKYSYNITKSTVAKQEKIQLRHFNSSSHTQRKCSTSSFHFVSISLYILDQTTNK